MKFENKSQLTKIITIILVSIISYKVIDNYKYFFGLLSSFTVILTPFIYAFIFAYVLNPVVKLFQKRLRLPRGISIALTYLLLAGIIFIGLFFTVPSVINSIINITEEIPSYVAQSQNWINSIMQNKKINELVVETGMMQEIQNWITEFSKLSITIVSDIGVYLVEFASNIFNTFIGFLISIYILSEKDNVLKFAKMSVIMIFKEKTGNKIINLVKTYNNMIGTYVGIKAIDSTIIGTIALIGMLVLKVPYAPLLAFVVGVTNMIPYFGPFVGILVSGLVTIFSSFWLTVMVCVFLLALQQFDGWYLDPKLIGKKVGVSPLAIIFGVTVGGGIMGPIGMLLGSPTMATIKIYFDRTVKKFKKKYPDAFEKSNIILSGDDSDLIDEDETAENIKTNPEVSSDKCTNKKRKKKEYLYKDIKNTENNLQNKKDVKDRKNNSRNSRQQHK